MVRSVSHPQFVDHENNFMLQSGIDSNTIFGVFVLMIMDYYGDNDYNGDKKMDYGFLWR